MWIHLDLASLQRHWLSLGVDRGGLLVFIKPTEDKAHDRLHQPARPRNKSCREDFPSLSSERETHTHTHFPRMELPLYKSTPTKRDIRKRFWRMAADPPWEKLQTSPYKRGHFKRNCWGGELLVFRGVVWACVRKAFVWSFFQERSCWAAIFTELWCLQNVFGTGSVNLSIYQSI